jgi:hypothetical protein
MRGVVVFALLVALCAGAWAQDRVKFKVFDMPSEFSTIERAKVIKIHSEAEWKDYWNRYVTANVEDHGQWKPMPLPAVDFKLNDVVAVHLGTYNDAGHVFVVDSVVQGRDAYTINIKTQPRRMVMHHVSHPALLIVVPRSRARMSVFVDGRGLQTED